MRSALLLTVLLAACVKTAPLQPPAAGTTRFVATEGTAPFAIDLPAGYTPRTRRDGTIANDGSFRRAAGGTLTAVCAEGGAGREFADEIRNPKIRKSDPPRTEVTFERLEENGAVGYYRVLTLRDPRRPERTLHDVSAGLVDDRTLRHVTVSPGKGPDPTRAEILAIPRSIRPAPTP